MSDKNIVKQCGKTYGFLSLGLFFGFSVELAALDGGGKNKGNTKMEPIIMAKISKSAIDKALSPDGLKAILGIFFGPQKYEGAISSNDKQFSKKTVKKMSIFAGTLGVEYAKSFRNGLFLAGNLLLDLGPKRKQSGDWKNVNESFDAKMDVHGVSKNERKVYIQTELFTPSVGVKVGYRFRNIRSLAYGKLELSRLAGRYKYTLNGKNFSTINANTLTLSAAVGGEYRVNQKIGVGFEFGFPIQRKTHKKKVEYGVEHLTRMSHVEIRLLGYYTISKPESMNSVQLPN